MKKPLLLIDGDQFVFKATAVLERECKWDEENHVLYSNPEQCLANVEAMLGRVFRYLNSNSHALCFSDPSNYFRRELDPSYKLSRAGSRKPLCYSTVRERLEGAHKTITMHGLEADDVMGILATKPGNSHAIIVSQDKDMKSIPTTVYDGKEILKVSEQEADYNHLFQTLVGDVSDGYKGCPGIGPVKAAALLHKQNDNWQVIVEAFKKAKLTEEDALLQARLARILRWSDWDAKEKKPILWSPPKTDDETV